MTTAFAFDLDGTITREEVLPIIASELSLEREMRTLTDLTLSGVIDFEESFRLRSAILRAVPISTVRAIVSEVELMNGIVDFIADRKESCFVVTGNLDAWIQPVLTKLGCRSFTSTAQFDNDRLIGVSEVLNKGEAARKIFSEFSRLVTIGDSVNDIPMFAEADLRVAYGGVHDPSPSLYEISDYAVFTEETLCRLLPTLS